MSQSSARLAAGRLLHGYRVVQERSIPELNIEATLLRHEATGAGHLHLARPDPSNLFAVQFRTTPRDSTGVAHILEHMVLDGSRRFPVKSPFFCMLTRSMASFMNAMTAPDWTMYPFVTHNAQDFRNLMNVYMDAVFFPTLSQLDFMQEAWRLEPRQGTESEQVFQFSGVVFNEMKGVFANNDYRFIMDVQQRLLPSHTYGVCSGGSPEHIPSLTWEQLRNFHMQQYHPSNAHFYTYGSLPLEDHLQFLQEHYLNDFAEQQIDTTVPLEPRWTAPRRSQVPCACDPGLRADQQTTVATSLLIGDVCDIYDTFVDNFVGSLLVNGDTSPFYRALLESRLGQNFAPAHGFDSSTRNTSFHVGLKGIRPDDVSNVFKVTQETLEKVADIGFDAQNVNSLLHQTELSLKHQSTQFGLNLVLGNLGLVWNHDADPLEAISYNKHIQRLRIDLSNPNFLRDRVRDRWLENPHRLETVMTPEDSFVERETEREMHQLSSVTSALSSEQRARVEEDNAAMLAHLNQLPNTDCLPQVCLSDMNRMESEHILKEDPAQRLFMNETHTNGVTYMRAFLPLSLANLPVSLLPLVPLFCECMTRCGAGGLDYRTFSQQEELYTGGLSASVVVEQDLHQAGQFEVGLLLSSHCLDENQAAMMDLWCHVFQGPALKDSERLLQLVQQRAADAGSSLSNNGHRYAMSRACAALGGAAWCKEIVSGLEQLRKAVWLGSLQRPQGEVQDKLEELANILMRRGQMKVFLAGDAIALQSAQESVGQWTRSMRQEEVTAAPISGQTADTCDLQLPRQFHLEVPYFMVNFVARSFATVPLSHPASMPLRVLAELISSRYLHRELREKGGAYGGGAVSSEGYFSMFSYRDPNTVATLNQFQVGLLHACCTLYS